VLRYSLLSLYKILFYFKALLWESIILVLPPPTCKAYLIELLLQTIEQYTRPIEPTAFYAIHHTILVMAISCKGQLPAPPPHRRPPPRLPVRFFCNMTRRDTAAATTHNSYYYLASCTVVLCCVWGVRTDIGRYRYSS